MRGRPRFMLFKAVLFLWPPLVLGGTISIDLCNSHHYGCHEELKYYASDTVILTNGDCVADGGYTLESFTAKKGGSAGKSMCWECALRFDPPHSSAARPSPCA